MINVVDNQGLERREPLCDHFRAYGGVGGGGGGGGGG